MALVEIAPIAEKSQGLAFEVKIKKTIELMTPARERLEAYGGQGRLPSLLQSRGQNQANAYEVYEERADKVRQQNEKKREVSERLKVQSEKSAAAKRLELESHLEKAAEKRQVTLADRSARAGKHFEAVVAKTGVVRSLQAGDTSALQQRLEVSQVHQTSLREATLAERIARASQHNESVAGKVLQHQEVLLRQTEELRGKDPAERLVLLSQRAYEHHFVPRPE
mmetsp:Transcript_32460/g.58232  ORF Transcript_32460/g.58232 Transcript_32460/m.58232 type:complete len:224 (-) Transcript_32460:316-987(-)